MSIFGNIASSIFGKGKTAGATSLAPGAPGAPGAPVAPAPQGTATAGGTPPRARRYAGRGRGDDQEDRRRAERETRLATVDRRLDEAFEA